MRRALTIYLALICSLIQAQVFDVDTLVYNGDVNTHINIVFLSDGYRSVELPQFAIDAQVASNALFAKAPFTSYVDHFNVFIVNVPSVDSGADHPGTAADEQSINPPQPVIDVDTYFNSTFDRNGIHRLLVPTNSSAILAVLANNVPFYDQVVVLVNSPYYGGSGGAYATASLHPSSNEIFIHEMGHSFAGLGDEYAAGGERVNRTSQTDPLLVKWKNWIGDQGIGIYLISGSSYRPHQSCLMRSLNNPFCAVCKQAIVETVHDMSSPIVSFTPADPSVGYSAPITFSLNELTPQPNTLRYQWKVNGVPQSGNASTVSINATVLWAGSNSVGVVIEDTTTFLRVDDHLLIHADSVNWTVTLPIRIQARAMLEGPYDFGTNFMHDSLRGLGSFPLVEPYSGIGYSWVTGGGETIDASMLGISGAGAIVDWVVLQLRDASNASIILADRAALIQRDGDIVDLDGGPVQFDIGTDDYYLAVLHRNHLGFMGGSAFPMNNSVVAPDFTLGTTVTFGADALKITSGTYLMWAGDVNFNGTLKYTGTGNDRDPILIEVGGNVPTNTTSGYHQEDVNMNGVVQYTGSGNDRDPILVNIGGSVPTNTRQQQVP